MSADVHIGRDGWMFLSGGSNEVLKYYTQPGYFAGALETWIRLIRTRSIKAESAGVDYVHMIVPDKISVYPECFLDPLPHASSTPSRALGPGLAQQFDGAALTRHYLDLLPLMQARKAEGPLYFKTDAHWVFLGSYVAYEALCRRLGAPVQPIILEAPTVTGDLFLDLGSKLNPPVSEPYVVHLFFTRAKRTHANCLVEFKETTDQPHLAGLHVGSHVVFKNDAPGVDPRTIVIFGDSYSEYRTHMLTGMLAETFAETHFIWSSNVDWDYVADVKANIVVTEMAERFMNLVPGDEFNAREFAEKRLAAFKAGQL